MKTFSPFLLAVCLIFGVHGSLQAQPETKTGKVQNGLKTVTFETKKGKVEVKIPEIIHAGDVISGTVIAEPKGKNERQITKNRNILNGYVVEIEETKKDKKEKEKGQPVNNRKGSWVLPEMITEGSIQLLLTGRRDKVMAKTPVAANPSPRSVPFPDVLKEQDFSVPPYLRAGESEKITGFFDGDFTSSAVRLNDSDVELLAESPGELFFETPEELSGPVDLEMLEDTFSLEEQTHVVKLDMTADKLSLMKGEQTRVHLKVSGLEGLETAVPLEFSNLTPGNIEVEGGNARAIIIRPEDRTEEGTFNLDLNVTAISRGGFSIMGKIGSPLLADLAEEPLSKGSEGERPAVPEEEEPPSETEDCCSISRSATHSNPQSELEISENYLDEEKRQVLDSIYENVPAVNARNQNSFIRSKLPASASSIGYLDVVSGYCNAICKHILVSSDGGSEWVWSTEELSTEATTSGNHNLSVATGEDCSSFVVGAAGGVVQTWTNGIDPVANHRTLLTVMKWTRDISIIVASTLLGGPAAGIAAGIATWGASKWFDSEFSTDCNAGVKAEAKILFRAKDRPLLLSANSGTTMSDDGEITSDNVKLCHGTKSWTDPASLTIETKGFCSMKCFAEDNGVVDGTIESQAGIVIIGFCFYENGGWRWEYLNCSSLGVTDKNPQGAIDRTTNLFETRISSLMNEAFPNNLTAEQVRNKAQTELPGKLEDLIRDWYMENAYDDEAKTGFFRLADSD